MKIEDCLGENSLRQSLANAKGKMSTQFMSGDLRVQNPSKNKSMEDSFRMRGYDVSVKRSTTASFDMKQPMAGYSEFWIG